MDFYYRNALRGRNDIYYYLPSRTMFGKGRGLGINGTSGLKIIYEKKNSGGKYKGGICGFITTLAAPPYGYQNLAPYKYLSFWIRGEKGGENLNLGVADKAYFNRSDIYRSLPVTHYLPNKMVTKEWQQVFFPMEYFKVNWAEIEMITINFDSYIFKNGEGEGTIYIDDLAFYSELPKDSEDEILYPHFP